MQIRTKVDNDGRVTVEVIDPSDGAVTHGCSPALGEQITVTATTAHSPADIEWGGCENIPEPEPDAETEAENERKVSEQPTPPDSDEEIDAAAEQAPEGEAEQGAAREKDL
jgi:hypothetical protein